MKNVAGEWASQLDGASVCSYPLEDLVVKDYGRFLMKRGKRILSEERVHTEPLATSLLDGIDLHETIATGTSAAFMCASFRKSREVGSIIVIFD